MGDESIRVLVLVRDRGFRTMCGQIVAMLGHDVNEVEESGLALDLLRSQQHHVVIVDWESLEQPRQERVAQLVSANPDREPVCVITCEPEREAEVAQTTIGPVLVKPVAPNLLMQAVTYAIENPAPTIGHTTLTTPAPDIDSGPILQDDSPVVESEAIVDDDAPDIDSGPILQDDSPIFESEAIVDDDAPDIDSGPILQDDSPIFESEEHVDDDAPDIDSGPVFQDDAPTGEQPTIAAEPVASPAPPIVLAPTLDIGPAFAAEPPLETSPELSVDERLETRFPEDSEPGDQAFEAEAPLEPDEEKWGEETTDVSGFSTSADSSRGERSGGHAQERQDADEAPIDAEPSPELDAPDTSSGSERRGAPEEDVADADDLGARTLDSTELEAIAGELLDEGETTGEITAEHDVEATGQMVGAESGDVLDESSADATCEPAASSAGEGRGPSAHEFIMTSGFVSEQQDADRAGEEGNRISSEYIVTTGFSEHVDGGPRGASRPTPAPDAAGDAAPEASAAAKHRGPIFRIPAKSQSDASARPSSVPLAAPAPGVERPAGAPSAPPPAPPEEVRQIVPGFPSRGELAEVPFVKLIAIAMLQKLTGSLSVTRRGLCQEFHFDAGKPVGISIDNPAGGLIPWLFGRDMISEAASDAALDEVLETGADQAGIIFRRQLLDPSALVAAMVDHYTVLCTETIGFADGTFSFREGKPVLSGPPLSGVNLPKIVVMGMIECAQAGHVIKLADLPVQAVPVPIKDAPIKAEDIPLPTLEARTRDLVLRRASIREIIDSSHLEATKAQAIVRALVVLGAIDVDPTGQSGPSRPTAAPAKHPTARPSVPPTQATAPQSARPTSAPPAQPGAGAEPAPPAGDAAGRASQTPQRPSAVPGEPVKPPRRNIVEYVHSEKEINVKAEMRQILKDYAEEQREKEWKPSGGLLSRLLADSPNREDWKSAVKKMAKQRKDEGGEGKGLLSRLFKK